MRVQHSGNEWIDVDNDVATFGLRLPFVKELEEILFIQLPEKGKRIEANRECVTLESSKAAIDIMCPLSGEVLEVNQDLVELPRLLLEDPEGKGWLFRLKKFDLAELRKN
jgi:glycine cleavage system H protein